MDEMSNLRLLRLREKMVNFTFKVKWIEGKNHLVADALSRSSVFQPKETEEEEKITFSKISKDPGLQSLFDAAMADAGY